MIEIVFGESACGSLKIAQTYGKGKYRGSAVSVFMRHEDGSVPSSDEMKEAQIQAQEQEHIAWENAIPLGGKSSDVYCFDMALSVGDISDNGIGEQRKNVLKKMLSVWFVEDLDYQVEEKIQKIKTTLSSVIERYVAGEEVRIWYSYNPDELCGMYWLMKQLRPLNCQTTIYLVKLPAWEYGKENTMTSKIAWGEVSPGEWGKYITLQEKAKPVFLSACAMKWNQLQNENAPLRAMLNGKLQSVSEDIYDSFILREIAEQPEQFKMAIVIGNVLGKYQLGISDVWISNRIDKMLEDGVYLKDLLEKRFGVPVYVNNDCNCFALGVSRFGEASAYSDVVCVALGTGVGAGIVIGGELYCGHDTGAGEIGSIPYLDRDYEYYCSSRFFVGRGTTGKEAYERALAGDPAALALWHEFGGHIGRLVMMILYAYDPEAIVFGGSIAHAFGFFREAMYEQLKQFPYAKTVERLHICCSSVEHVGLLGASACE